MRRCFCDFLLSLISSIVSMPQLSIKMRGKANNMKDLVSSRDSDNLHCANIFAQGREKTQKSKQNLLSITIHSFNEKPLLRLISCVFTAINK